MTTITNEQIKKYASCFDPKNDEWAKFAEWTLYDLILEDMDEETSNNERLCNNFISDTCERVRLCHFKTEEEITKDEIDWEEQFNILKEGIDYLMEGSKKDRKKIRELEKELRESHTKVIETELYEINLNFYSDHHSWGYKDGTEGGELIIKNKELIDYDGTYQLGIQILNALNKEGINVQDIR